VALSNDRSVKRIVLKDNEIQYLFTKDKKNSQINTQVHPSLDFAY